MLRMLETGALHKGVCLPWADDCVVRIAPETPAGQRHEDLLGYTAARIRQLFAKGEGRTRRNHPFNDFEVAAEALGFEADWLQQRATMFGRGLKLELLKRRMIFTLSPREILLSHVPSEPFLFEFLPSSGPLFNLIPGLSSPSRNSGGLRPEHKMKPSEFGSFTHIPGMYVPFIEDWYRDLARDRFHSARLIGRLERGDHVADDVANEQAG
jgi:hypothetical protein